ncbi:cobyrinic acid a,c-diamide synthase [Klebsiella pneumoniae]|uniref:Cobyrinic acid a,c-diamide synthase n=1 Tax=Klebsiella pneumoniae TaxID=573 RepID=A0A2X3CU76_KLEPN|nr:cobyrinic acid a,c-diamide synthase [Klebsiella pneumoniae]
MGTRLTRFGYCEAQAQQQTLLAAPGEWLRGHEFHYSDFSPATPAVLACRKQRDGKTLQQWQGGLAVRQRLCQLSPCPFCPASHHAQPLVAGSKGGRYDPSRLVCSLDT